MERYQGTSGGALAAMSKALGLSQYDTLFSIRSCVSSPVLHNRILLECSSRKAFISDDCRPFDSIMAAQFHACKCS